MRNVHLISFLAILISFPVEAQDSNDNVSAIKLGKVSPIRASVQVHRSSYKSKFEQIKTSKFRIARRSEVAPKSITTTEITIGRKTLSVSDSALNLRMDFDKCVRNGNQVDCPIRNLNAQFTTGGEVVAWGGHSNDGDKIDISGKRGKFFDKFIKALLESQSPFKGGWFESGDVIAQGQFQLAGYEADFRCIATGISVILRRPVLVCEIEGKFRSKLIDGDGNFTGKMAIDIKTGATVFSESHLELEGEHRLLGGKTKMIATEVKKLKIVSPVQTGPFSGRSIEQRLMQLKGLLDKGLISEEDARRKRLEILRNL